jgi:hypothetical protein
MLLSHHSKVLSHPRERITKQGGESHNIFLDRKTAFQIDPTSTGFYEGSGM